MAPIFGLASSGETSSGVDVSSTTTIGSAAASATAATRSSCDVESVTRVASTPSRANARSEPRTATTVSAAAASATASATPLVSSDSHHGRPGAVTTLCAWFCTACTMLGHSTPSALPHVLAGP